MKLWPASSAGGCPPSCVWSGLVYTPENQLNFQICPLVQAMKQDKNQYEMILAVYHESIKAQWTLCDYIDAGLFLEGLALYQLHGIGPRGGEKNVQLVSLSICNVVKEMSSDISKRKIFKLYLSEDTWFPLLQWKFVFRPRVIMKFWHVEYIMISLFNHCIAIGNKTELHPLKFIPNHIIC